MNSVKRRDIGIAGALIILSQAITSSQSSNSITNQIDELRNQLIQLKVDREQYFVRKDELKKVINKLDKMQVDIATINEQIKWLRHMAELDTRYDEEVVGCLYERRDDGLGGRI